MATPEEVEAALRAISQLADEHGRALDKAFRILGDGALTGPGAVRLQQGMTARHGDVREALEGAFEEVRRLAARNPKGPPKVPPPRMGRAPAGARPSQGDKAGGDPELLKLLQAEMNRAGRSWEAAGQQLGGLLSRLGLSQSPGRAVGQAGNWVVGQRRDVQRRREELLKSDQVSPAFAVGLFAFNMTRTLAALQADPKLTAQLRRAGVDPTKIPAAEDPKQAATWWKSLNDEQRRLYIKTFPAVIGWLDGLPAVARDAANRLTLANRIKQLQATPANERTTFETRDLGGLMNLDVRLKDLKAQGKDVYLLGLDSTTPGPWDGFDSGKNPFPPLFPGYDKLGRAIADTKSGPDGRVIVAIGNPDTADHTGVFVPGTTTELDNFEKELKRGESLWNATNEQAKGQPVSIITWLGYDAPDHIVSNSPERQYADDGGPRLDSFINGVRAAQGDVHRHVTSIGHSYGSTVIGEGARKGDGLAVDDIVVAGSPGMRVPHARDLHIDPHRVWAQQAKGDPVPDIGRFGHGGRDWRSFGKQIVPSDSQFGGRQMTTDTTGHSNYWQQGTTSLRNQAKVVAGTHTNNSPFDDPELEFPVTRN